MANGNNVIGKVTSVKGSASATLSDGKTVPLQVGSEVHQGDVLNTAADSSVGVTFVDSSTFSLGAKGRMTLDELVFDPNQQTGSSAISVAHGAFAFVSGQLAKSAPDAMKIKTPVMTIGIRGTSATGNIQGEGQSNTIALLADADGHVGQLAVYNAAGVMVLSVPLTGITLNSNFQAPPAPVSFTLQQIQQSFGAALNSLPPGTLNQQYNNNNNNNGNEHAPTQHQQGGEKHGNATQKEAAIAEARAQLKEFVDGIKGDGVNHKTALTGLIETFLGGLKEVVDTIDAAAVVEAVKVVIATVGPVLDVTKPINLDVVHVTPDPDNGTDPDGLTWLEADKLHLDDPRHEVAGTAVSDVAMGGTTNDVIDGGDGNDVLVGYTNRDIEVVNGYVHTLPVLTQRDGNDTLAGGAGNDTLIGGSGFNTLDGGEGDDSAMFANLTAGVTLTTTGNGAGKAVGEQTETQFDNVENLYLTNYADTATISHEFNYIQAGGGADVVSVVENGKVQSLDGGFGSDTLTVTDNATATYMTGGLGNDRMTVSGSGSATWVQGGFGNDVLHFGDNAAVQMADGSQGNDSVVVDGHATVSSLWDSAGNDSFAVGGDGSVSLLAAGEGDDVVTVSERATVQSLDGGEGNDTFVVDGHAVVASLWDSAGNNTFAIGGDGVVSLLQAGEGNDVVTLTEQARVPSLDVGHGDDIVTVTDHANADYVYGRQGNDRITVDRFATVNWVEGGFGDDLLHIGGNAVVQVVAGSEGDDTVVVDGQASVGNLWDSVGNDTFTISDSGSVTLLLAGVGDNVVTVSGHASVANLYVNGGTNRVTFAGTATSTYLVGGDDVDTFSLADSSSVSSLMTNGGRDTVSVSGSATVQDLQSGYGDDTIVIGGTAQIISLAAGDGRDVVSVSGTATVQYLDSGEGNDTLTVGEQAHLGWLSTGGGHDTITIGGAATLSQISAGDGDDIVSITGTGGSNYVDGGAGNDTLTFSQGADVGLVFGGEGADRLVLGGGATVDTLLAGAGADTIIIGGTAAASWASGGDGDDVITVTGQAIVVTLDGGSGNDIITGGSGNETLLGGVGSDVLTGGGGADLFIYNVDYNNGASQTDRVTDFTVAQGDRITVNGAQAGSFSWTSGLIGSTQYGMLSDTQTNNVIAIGGTRPDQVEFDGSEIQFSAGGKLKSKDIALGGSISGSTNGSYYSDLLIAFGTAVALGSAHTRPLIPQGSVTLLGGDGDDRLVNAVTGTVGTVSHVGGQGSDFIVAGQNRDVIVWQGDSDYIDTVSGFSAASNDQILITGRATDFHWVTNHADGSSSWSGLVNGYGYGIHFSQGQGGADQVAFNNTVVFSQGGVFKSGNSGIIAGGTGDDLLMAFGAASAGAVTLQGNAGADLLYDYSSAGKTVVFDGGAGNDVMTGGGGNDTFLGGDGADTMYGGSGANTFTGGGGNDIIYVSVGNKSANDLVTDFNAGADTINVTTTVDGSPLSAADFIWNQSTSTLSRADGVGGGLQFSNSTIFSAADFTNQSIRFNTGATAYGYVYSSTAYASINGSTGDDLMLAFGMGSTLAGGDGDDRLMSFASAANYSELRGGAGNDVYVLGAAHDRVVWTPETDGTDVIHGFDVTADYVEIRSSGSIVNEMTWESSLGKLAYFDGFTTSYLFFADGDRPDQVAFASGRVTFVVDGSQSGSVISSIGASLTGDSVGDDLLISTATGFASLQVNLTDGSNDVAVLNSGSETVVWSVSHDGMEVAVQNFDASKDVISCDSIIAGDLRWDADYSQFVYYNQDAQITTTLMIDGDRPDEVAFDGSETLFFNSVLKSADSGTLTGTSEGDLLMGLADSTHGVTFNGGQGDDVLVGGGGADRFNVGFTDSDKVVIDQFDWHADTLSITRNGFAAADFRMESWDDGLFSGFGLYSEADQSLDLAGKAIFFTTPQDIEVDGSRVTFAGGGVFDIQDGVGSIAGSSGDDLLYAKGEIGGGASISLSGGAGDDALIAKSVGSGTVILNGGTGDDTMETSATCGVTFAYSGVRSLSRSGETDSLIVKDGDKITFSDSDWAALTFGSSTALNKVMGGSVNIMFDDTNSQIIIDMPTNGSPTGNHTIGAEDFYIQLQGMNDSYTISDVLIDNTTHSLTI